MGNTGHSAGADESLSLQDRLCLLFDVTNGQQFVVETLPADVHLRLKYSRRDAMTRMIRREASLRRVLSNGMHDGRQRSVYQWVTTLAGIGLALTGHSDFSRELARLFLSELSDEESAALELLAEMQDVATFDREVNRVAQLLDTDCLADFFQRMVDIGLIVSVGQSAHSPLGRTWQLVNDRWCVLMEVRGEMSEPESNPEPEPEPEPEPDEQMELDRLLAEQSSDEDDMQALQSGLDEFARQQRDFAAQADALRAQLDEITRQQTDARTSQTEYEGALSTFRDRVRDRAQQIETLRHRIAQGAARQRQIAEVRALLDSLEPDLRAQVLARYGS